MDLPFGPQLIGRTEKALGAILQRHLNDVGLTEPQWVTLRLAAQAQGPADPSVLARTVAEQARFGDAEELVSGLTERDLLSDGRLTHEGSQLVAEVQASITAHTAAMWDDLPAEDLAATTRSLNTIDRRARALLT